MAKNTIKCKIGKTVVKFNVIRDYDGEVRGYSLGDYKLVKVYTWGNSYSWVIAKKDVHVGAMNCEIYRQDENGEVEFVSSCKAGKERLVDLYIEGVRLW